MNIFHAIVLGLVEGITEFLPVSSTFHLIAFASMLGIQNDSFVKVFEIIIQFGAILAIVFLYRKDLVQMRTMYAYILLAFIPTGIVGFLLYPIVRDVFFESYTSQAILFIVVGVIFIIFERLVAKGRIQVHYSLSHLTWKTAIIIGFIQSIALFPGVSRAGAVMLGMMLLGFKRFDSAKFSFLLALPTIGAATLYEGYKSKEVLLQSGDNLMLLVVGFVVSMISAYFCVKLFVAFLQKHTLALFGWYRIIVGIILLTVMMNR